MAVSIWVSGSIQIVTTTTLPRCRNRCAWTRSRSTYGMPDDGPKTPLAPMEQARHAEEARDDDGLYDGSCGVVR
jgi:hypothetical protein